MKDLIFLIVIFIGAISFAVWGFVLNKELKVKNIEYLNLQNQNDLIKDKQKADSVILSNYQEALIIFMKKYPIEYRRFESIIETLETK